MKIRTQLLRELATYHQRIADTYKQLAEVEGDYTPGCPLTEACKAVGVSVAEIQSDRRYASLSAMRFMVCALLRLETGMGLERIAELICKADHGTVSNALKRHRVFLEMDPAYRLRFESAKQTYCAARIRVVQQQETEAA